MVRSWPLPELTLLVASSTLHSLRIKSITVTDQSRYAEISLGETPCKYLKAIAFPGKVSCTCAGLSISILVESLHIILNAPPG